MNSEIKLLSVRIRFCAKKVGSGNELARLIGVPRNTLERWLTGNTAPKFLGLGKIAKAAQVSGTWLLTGEGEPELKSESIDTQAYKRGVDPKLHSFILVNITKVYKEIGTKLRDTQTSELVTEIYNGAIEDADDLATQKIVASALIKAKKKGLTSPEHSDKISHRKRA